MPSSTDNLNRAIAELDSMRAVAEILAALPDDDSRARVLRWCDEHFLPGGSVRAAQPLPDDDQRPPSHAGGAGNDALTVGDDVFDGPARKRERLRADDLEVDDEPAAEDEIVHCADLWIDASDLEPAPKLPEPPRQPASLGLESMLRDFVADFQRLALEWQTA